MGRQLLQLQEENAEHLTQVRPSSKTAVSTHIHTCPPTSTRCMIFHEWRIASVTFAVGLHTVNFTSAVGICTVNLICWWLADSSDFVFLGKQSSTKLEIPCPGRRWTTVQNLTPLALSSPEKYVTVQTHKITNIKWYIHTLLSACVNNKINGYKH